MQEYLAAIEQAHRDFGRNTVPQLLQPGVSASDVRASLDEIALRSTGELEALYQWHNGIADSDAPIGEISLWPGYFFSSLEDAVADYRDYVTEDSWQLGWLPVFPNGGGCFYVVDLSIPGSAPVRHWQYDELEHPVEFMSLTDMVATLDQAFRRGCFYVMPEGTFDMDHAAFRELAAEMSPEVDWWRS